MDDARFMQRAIRLALRGQGFVEPNPMVGCVIVKSGRIVGEGWHKKFGGPHAEVEALRRAGSAARGSTVYVSLEPCCHHGKTPPCTDALIAARVKRVVVAAVDPFPAVSGKGIAALQAAGIHVDVGIEQAAALDVLEPFIKRVVTGRPFVIAKWASTLDGAIATSTGHSQWISSDASRADVHELRGRVDAILVGIGTALADDPALTARNVKVRRVARRIVIDPAFKLPLKSQIIRTLDAAPLTLVTAHEVLKGKASAKLQRLRKLGVQFLGLPRVEPARRGKQPPGNLDLRPLMYHLVAEHQAANILVEGGARTLGSFIEQDLVDELQVYVAPKLLGDAAHVGPVHLSRPVLCIDHARPLQLKSVQRIGDDLKLRYRL